MAVRAEGRDNQQSDHDLQARMAYRAECSLFHYPWLLATGFYNLFRPRLPSIATSMDLCNLRFTVCVWCVYVCTCTFVVQQLWKQGAHKVGNASNG